MKSIKLFLLLLFVILVASCGSSEDNFFYIRNFQWNKNGDGFFAIAERMKDVPWGACECQKSLYKLDISGMPVSELFRPTSGEVVYGANFWLNSTESKAFLGAFYHTYFIDFSTGASAQIMEQSPSLLSVSPDFNIGVSIDLHDSHGGTLSILSLSDKTFTEKTSISVPLSERAFSSSVTWIGNDKFVIGQFSNNTSFLSQYLIVDTNGEVLDTIGLADGASFAVPSFIKSKNRLIYKDGAFIKTFSFDSKKIITLDKIRRDVPSFKVSSDGLCLAIVDTVVYNGTSNLFFVNPVSGAEVFVDKVAEFFDFSPDGKKIAYISPDHTAYSPMRVKDIIIP